MTHAPETGGNQLPNSVDFSSLYKFKNSLDATDCSLYWLVKLTLPMCFYVF